MKNEVKLFQDKKIRSAWVDAQNQRYKRLIARLTDTWYGKILRKIYHLFQRLGIL